MGNRTVATYLVLERHSSRGGRARVVRHAASKPTLQRGQVAVRVELAVPDEAFEPVLAGPSLAFAVEDTFRAEVKKA